MRTNSPVTGKQYDYPASEQLVSVTDLKGIIRYGNPAFIKVSGFSEAELIGQPHNLVRHPDMPAAAFADMWSTLRNGRPWTALVKNRRKNGDYYWVRANVTPIVERGKTVGYLSVRVKPSAQEVADVQAPYAALRAASQDREAAGIVHAAHADKAANAQNSASRREADTPSRPRSPKPRRSGYALRQGRLYRTGLRGLWQRVSAPTIANRATAAFALPALTTVAFDRIAQTLSGASHPWASLFAVVATSVLSGFWLTRSINRPLEALIRSTNLLAACDLTPDGAENRRDELGDVQRALTQLRANLSAVVADVHTQSNGVRAAVQEIAAGNADLAARTERQAAYLARTKDTVQALHAATGVTSQHVRDTVDTAREAADAAENGEKVIGNVISTMEIVAQSSSRVRDITSLIDGIAFQTNLLALNAAVEAARAGEHGRSFSVVAGEVRLLAKRCADAASEIDGLVTDTVDQVQKGAVMAKAAGATMHSIVETFSRTMTVVAQLETTGQRQTRNIDEVEAALTELDSVTQQNAALVEQVATNARQQSMQTDVLRDAVNIFTYNGKLATEGPIARNAMTDNARGVSMNGVHRLPGVTAPLPQALNAAA